jgi:hypothetical protein
MNITNINRYAPWAAALSFMILFLIELLNTQIN